MQWRLKIELRQCFVGVVKVRYAMHDGKKHDLPNAMNASEITNKFDLHSLQQICCSVCSKVSSCCH